MAKTNQSDLITRKPYEATAERLDSLLPLRLQLEGEATSRAIALASAGLADDIQAINDDLDVLAASDDIKAYLRQNQNFHFTVYRACGNEDLIDLIELLWMRYGPLMSIVRSGALSEAGHLNHSLVIDAVRRGDADAGAAAIRADIGDAAKSIRGAIVGNQVTVESRTRRMRVEEQAPDAAAS